LTASLIVTGEDGANKPDVPCTTMPWRAWRGDFDRTAGLRRHAGSADISIEARRLAGSRLDGRRRFHREPAVGPAASSW
jgi:hypothetical protein